MKQHAISSSKLANLMFALLFSALPFSDCASAETYSSTPSGSITQKKTVYFPQFTQFDTVKNEGEMLYEIHGRLDLVNNCLRVVTKQATHLLIWPGNYDFSISGREIVINNANDGTEVTRLKMGDTVSLSGAELVYLPATLQYGVPDQCLGPFWAVGDVKSVQPAIPAVKPSVPPVNELPENLKSEPKPIKKPSQPKIHSPKKPKIEPKLVKKSSPTKKSLSKKVKKSNTQDIQLRKLEIELEKTMLK